MGQRQSLTDWHSDTAAICSRLTRAKGQDYSLDFENTNWPSVRNLSEWSTCIVKFTWRVFDGLERTYFSFMAYADEINEN